MFIFQCKEEVMAIKQKKNDLIQENTKIKSTTLKEVAKKTKLKLN